MADYKKIGFKCGLEIHIQLNMEKKLFCNCPNRRSAEFPVKIRRQIRPAAGELGKVDPAALHEFLRGRMFSYLINSGTACLVETDEEPPHAINAEALEIALSAAKTMGCSVPDEIHVMRKAVADGSAVSGFQRTALIGLNGILQSGQESVSIANLSLEEDSAAPAEGKNGAEFRLDRLGVPLIEIGTGPDIRSPAQAKLIAERIGMMLFQNRLRGIGAIRQDLNVSIRGGARVEIKGVQELGMIETVIENEIKRQQSLIEIRDELTKRKATTAGRRQESPSIGLGEIKDVTEPFKNTQSNLIQKALKDGGSVFAGVLKGFAGMMKKDCGGRTFGKELSSYAGVFGLGMIHSDELDRFPFLAEDFAALRKELGAREGDMIFIVAGKGAERVCLAVIERAGKALKGVPEETRAANADGTTAYMRPLPGAARMYPETDVPAITLTKDFLSGIEPLKPVEGKLLELEKVLPKQMAGQMIKSDYLALFDKIVADIKKQGIAPEQLKERIRFIASTFIGTLTSLKREGVPVESIPDEKIYEILAKPLAASKELLPELLKSVANSPAADICALIPASAGKLSRKDAENIIRETIEKNRDALSKPSAFNIIMGEAMKMLRGQIDGKIIADIVKKEIEERKKHL